MEVDPWTHLQPDAVERQLWYHLLDASIRTEDQLDAAIASLHPLDFDDPQMRSGFVIIRDMRESGRLVDVQTVQHEAARRGKVIDWFDPIEVSRCAVWASAVPEYTRILREARRARELRELMGKATTALEDGYPAPGVAARLAERLAEWAAAG